LVHTKDPPNFHLTSHFEAHSQCLASSSPVAPVGRCACTIPRAGSVASLLPRSICRLEGMTLHAAVSELRVSVTNLSRWELQVQSWVGQKLVNVTFYEFV